MKEFVFEKESIKKLLLMRPYRRFTQVVTLYSSSPL